MMIPIYGSLGIQGYGLALALGIIVIGWLLERHERCRRLLTSDQIGHLLNGSVFAGLLGARALNYLTEYQLYPSFGSVFILWEGGYDSWGAIIGVVCFISLYAYRLGYTPLVLLDIGGQYAPLLQAIARVGCYSYGCCGGIATTLPWGLINAEGVIVHPTQLYSSILYGALFCCLQIITRRHERTAGKLFAWYLMGAASERFLVDFFRDDRIFSAFSAYISIPQGIALCVLGIGIGVWVSARSTVVKAHEYF